jgi:hypothetical protein
MVQRAASNIAVKSSLDTSLLGSKAYGLQRELSNGFMALAVAALWEDWSVIVFLLVSLTASSYVVM